MVGYPEQVRAALVLAVGARATADQIGTQSTQIAAITSDPELAGRGLPRHRPLPDAGLQLARQFAHLTYRGEAELDTAPATRAKVMRTPCRAGATPSSYLEHQGSKLVKRFDAGSYVTLTETLSNHDVGRGRGGRRALSVLPGADRGGRDHLRPALPAAPSAGAGRVAPRLSRPGGSWSRSTATTAS